MKNHNVLRRLGELVTGRGFYIVMALAVASALAKEDYTITDSEAVAKSAPGFWEEYRSLGGIAR